MQMYKLIWKEEKQMSDDEIKMDLTTVLTNKNGDTIPVNTQSPEYMTETFSWDGVERSGNSKQDE